MDSKTIGSITPDFLFIWTIFRSFLMKAVLAALIVSPIQIHGLFTSLAWPFLIMASASCFLTLIIGRMKEKGYLFYYLSVGAPINLVLTFIMGVPIWATVVSILFTLWAIMKELEGSANDELMEGNGIIPATVIIGLCIWITAGSFQLNFLFPVLYLVLFQLLLFSHGTFVKRLIESEKPYKKKGYAIALVFAAFTIPVAAALIIVFMTRIVRTLLGGVVELFASLLMFLMEPVMRVFTKVLYGSMKNDMLETVPVGESGFSEDENLLTFVDTGSSVGIMIIVIAIFIIISVFALKNVKFTKVYQFVGNNGATVKTRPIDETRERKQMFDPGYSQAKHVIRKEMKSLEKFACKYELERAQYETIREWLNRIGIQPSLKWIAVYEKVRYGNAEIDEEQVAIFTAEIKRIKTEVKEQSKKDK